MARVKIRFPEESPLFVCSIPVRIGDINYGNHLGNDAVLSIIHEARMQFLSQWGYTELDVAGVALIMADVMIAYKSEAFYGETLEISLFATEITGRTFDFLYRITTVRNSSPVEVAHAKTGMICFDYQSRSITNMTDELKSRLTSMEI